MILRFLFFYKISIGGMLNSFWLIHQKKKFGNIILVNFPKLRLAQYLKE